MLPGTGNVSRFASEEQALLSAATSRAAVSVVVVTVEVRRMVARALGFIVAERDAEQARGSSLKIRDGARSD
jgi:hypothetical protein